MGLVISIYSKAAFKEFILPSVKNADHEITLRSNYFRLKEDLKLHLEVLDGIWKIKRDKYYSIVNENRRVEYANLEDGSGLTLHSIFQDAIHLFVKWVDSSLHVYRKFSLYGVNEIQIGRSPENHICYDYRGMVSKHHAVIKRSNKGFEIVNSGQNGIYVNSVWTKSGMELKFGSYINILGLHMVYLGDVLAIDAADERVRIDEKFLKTFHLSENATMYLKADNRKSVGIGGITYHRAPRNYEKLDSGTIEIEAPPEKGEEKKKSLFASIGPSLTMSLPMLLGGFLMAFSRAKRGNTSLYMYSGL
ncbi:MAG: FHA domain-containing protein, partial [Lachnospiraceae bacterium]|nr:FHA domain-containing protein [Lachnospiraceae bacterium]